VTTVKYTINADGSIPKDNPFVGVANARSYLYLRQSQSARNDQTSCNRGIWEHEHGPQGGDEINIVKGANYGWPVATYGIDDNTIISNIQQKKAFKILYGHPPSLQWNGIYKQ
jgi:glucose/arabinose dehydrogenase